MYYYINVYTPHSHNDRKKRDVCKLFILLVSIYSTKLAYDYDMNSLFVLKCRASSSQSFVS